MKSNDEATKSEPEYMELVRHYERCLERHGDTHLGVDWPNAADAARRYSIMAYVLAMRPGPAVPTLVDVGCGTGHFLEYLRTGGVAIDYLGIDLSPAYLAVCRRKFPDTRFLQQDLLAPSGPSPHADFLVANGLFTEKLSLSWNIMWDYCQRMVLAMFRMTRVAMAFNVMSTHVDWQRDDLFHLSHDTLVEFLRLHVSRHYMLRADYGLREYTVYVFREPT